MGALRRVIEKEFVQLRRDRRMIPILIVMPVVQLLVLGFAANLDVDNISLVVVDRDRTAASRALVDRFTGSGYFDLVGTESSIDDVDAWLVEGRARIVLVVPERYGADLAAGRTPELQLLADGTDNIASGLGLGYSGDILARVGETIARDRIARVAGPAVAGAGPPAIELVPRVWFNPDLRSRWFYTPAILALVLMLMTMILPSMAVVREKEIGTLEQLSVTPIRPWQLIVGKLAPFALIGMLDLLFVTALVVGVFGVPLRGGLGTLVILTVPFLLTTLGAGLLFSTLVRTQQQAMMASTFFGMIPMIYLSGLIFPIENMPESIRMVTYAIPLRYYADIIRGVFLRGSGLDVLWRDGVILAAYGVGLLALATLRFRKSLD